MSVVKIELYYTSAIGVEGHFRAYQQGDNDIREQLGTYLVYVRNLWIFSTD